MRSWAVHEDLGRRGGQEGRVRKGRLNGIRFFVKIIVVKALLCLKRFKGAGQ